MKKRVLNAAALLLPAGICTAVLIYAMIKNISDIPCIFADYTGILCPGCGATRAMRLLLQGELLAAIRMNPYIFIAFPVCACALLKCLISYLRAEKCELGRYLSGLLICVAVLGVIFTLLRNLPGFEFLAPI